MIKKNNNCSGDYLGFESLYPSYLIQQDTTGQFMDRSRIAYLIKRLRGKQATAEEKAELDEIWRQASDETLFDEVSDDESDSIRASILEGVKSKISLLEKSQRPSRPLTPSVRWSLKIAASVSFIVIISIFWTVYLHGDVQRFETAYGEHLTVELPDRSIVVLNGNSTLQYKSSWDVDKDREVWIEGEGFFEVTHTINHQKFIVHTERGMHVEVLGTKFNVKTRRYKAEVMLQEGKVNVEVGGPDSSETMTLQPGDLATLKDSRLTKVRVEPKEYSAWKEYKLFFDQTPLREVAHILEDTYGLQLIFGSESLSDRKLSGAISSEKPDDILKAIEESLNVTITREGAKVVLISNH